jgi:hypothetical protein
MSIRFVASAVALLAFCSSPVLGQLAQGELRGTIVDESGAVLPGVNITATQVETGTSRVTTTAANGTYLMPAMPLGTSKVTAELSGFGTTIREGFRLGVGEAVTINFTMKVAALQESVTVSGAPPIIDTKKSELTGHVDPEQVQSLPLNGRNWLDLVSLVPGARGNPGDIRAGASGGDAARYQMDGLSVTGQGTGGETQSYSQEIIAEVEVLTNRYDAEYGRVTGAVVNAVTKTGTNRFRGSGYYYLRDDSLNTKDFITGAVTPLHQPQEGFTLGGPLVRDRAFFFSSYEYQKASITNRPSTGVSQFDVNIPAPQTRHLVSARVDDQLNGQHRLFARTNPFKELRLNEGISTRTTATGGDNYRAYNQDAVVGETWVVSNRLVNEVRTGVFYFSKSLEELAQIPRYSFPSAIIGPASNNPQWWRERIYQANESMSYFLPGWHGDHKLKAGFQYQRSYYQGELPSKAYGQFKLREGSDELQRPEHLSGSDAVFDQPRRFRLQRGQPGVRRIRAGRLVGPFTDHVEPRAALRPRAERRQPRPRAAGSGARPPADGKNEFRSAPGFHARPARRRQVSGSWGHRTILRQHPAQHSHERSAQPQPPGPDHGPQPEPQ